jgi:5-formyltetrahydrofolate cyclo-ligase
MAAPHPSDPADAKRDARQAALTARAGCDPAWGVRLAAHVMREIPPPPGAVVSGFWPLEGEIDIRPLLEALHDRGHRIVLPATPPRGQPLSFHLWQPGAPMIRERFGTLRPEGPALAPDILFVPLLAFDRRGRRLGYGAGYYDRTLAGLPGRTAIGCAFAAQELDEVPVGPYDAPLSAVATERGVLRFGG